MGNPDRETKGAEGMGYNRKMKRKSMRGIWKGMGEK